MGDNQEQAGMFGEDALMGEFERVLFELGKEQGLRMVELAINAGHMTAHKPDPQQDPLGSLLAGMALGQARNDISINLAGIVSTLRVFGVMLDMCLAAGTVPDEVHIAQTIEHLRVLIKERAKEPQVAPVTSPQDTAHLN